MSKQQSQVSSKKNNSRSRTVQTQYAALPYRVTKTRGIEFLLVTSRESGRWIIPKGWPIAGLQPARSAAQEAYEEAGVRGVIGTAGPSANYLYNKEDRTRGRNAALQGHGLRVLLVRRQRRTWPEAHQRRSGWVRPRKALSLIDEKALRSLVAGFEESLHAQVAANGLGQNPRRIVDSRLPRFGTKLG